MNRSRPLIAILTGLALLVGAATSEGRSGRSHRRALTAHPAAPGHSIPPAFAGFSAPFWDNSWQALDPRLRQATAGLSPGSIRVFGGVNANYWNWQTGKFYDRPGVPAGLRRASRTMTPIHLSDWAKLVAEAHATPVFDLNLVTSNLSDQLDMLHAAQNLGMPIRWIELGNEVFLHQPALEHAFPTVDSYGREATRWIEAIRADFPAARVAPLGPAT